MSVSDPISDMLTRIRNAIIMGHALVALPSSNIKVAIAKILKDEGYIGGFEVDRRFQNAEGDVLEEWRELNTRWFQYGTFCPIFRVHGRYP